jgi:arylsulfatase A-like enzyme
MTEKEEGQTVIQWNSFITTEDKILPHYLRELGYSTGMVGKNHVVEVPNLYQFPNYHADPNDPEIKKLVVQNYEKVVSQILKCGFDFVGGIYHNNPNFIGLADLAVQNMDWIAEAGLNFIDQYHQDPFFLYFATTIPHQPSNAERAWKADPRVTAKGYLENPPNILPPRSTLNERIKEAGLQENKKELVLWLDDALGAILDKLEEHNILDNTIIFFFNDHGQSAKGSLYQGGTLNPSIVWRSRGFKVGNICNTRVANVDFTPTILELAGAGNVDDKFDGNSFLNVLNGNTTESRESLYFELGYARAVIKGDYKYLAVRYPEYAQNMSLAQRKEVLDGYNKNREFRNMVIVNRDPAAPFSHFSAIPGGQHAEFASYGKNPAYFEADQLFNLTKDPDELVNLANDEAYQTILDDMKKELQRYLNQLPGKFGELKTSN